TKDGDEEHLLFVPAAVLGSDLDPVQVPPTELLRLECVEDLLLDGLPLREAHAAANSDVRTWPVSKCWSIECRRSARQDTSSVSAATALSAACMVSTMPSCSSISGTEIGRRPSR